MDTSIARSGRPLDIYGALMRGYQGAMVRQQDQQQQEDRTAFLGALSQRYANDPTAGVLARSQEGQKMLEMEQEQAKRIQERSDSAAPVLAGVAEQLKGIPDAERAEVIGGFVKEYSGRDPEMAQLLNEAFSDVSNESLDRKIALGRISNPVKVYGNSYWGKDSEGNDVLVAMDERGRSHVVDNPPGVNSLSPPIDYLNVNSGFVPVPRYGQIPQGGGGQIHKGIDPAQQPEFISEQTAAQKGTEAAITASTKAYEQIASVSKSIANYDDAIKAIDSGAATDKISDMFPSLRVASIELDNVRGRMGLDVVGATTFGSLSESELAFALDTAMPKLPPPEMKKWLKRKKAAQIKLRDQLMDAAAFLGTGRTIPEYLQYLSNKGQYKKGENNQTPEEKSGYPGF